jgi:CP family cyanate transporter-like MFS transporter
MGVVAALGSAAAVPLADAYGWQAALAAFVVVPLAAMAVWATQWRSATTPAPVDAQAQPPVPIWRSALAWQITFYLGLNSTIYYVAIAWLPSILAESGVSAQQAGTLHGVLQLASAIPGLVLGPIVQRMTDQRLAAALAAAMSAMALLGFWLLPTLSWLWAVLFGVGTGATFILGLTFVALRTRDVAQSTALSGMSQSVGYLLAAVAPMAMGALHDRLGGWQVPLLVCAALAAVAVVMGALAGRNRQIAA